MGQENSFLISLFFNILEGCFCVHKQIVDFPDRYIFPVFLCELKFVLIVLYA